MASFPAQIQLFNAHWSVKIDLGYVNGVCPLPTINKLRSVSLFHSSNLRSHDRLLLLYIKMDTVLEAVQALTEKFDGLSERVQQMEQNASNEREASRSDTVPETRPSRSRSRQSTARQPHRLSPYRSRSRSTRTPSPKRKRGHHAGAEPPPVVTDARGRTETLTKFQTMTRQ